MICCNVLPIWFSAGNPFIEASASLMARKRNCRSQMATPMTELQRRAARDCCGSTKTSAHVEGPSTRLANYSSSAALSERFYNVKHLNVNEEQASVSVEARDAQRYSCSPFPLSLCIRQEGKGN